MTKWWNRLNYTLFNIQKNKQKRFLFFGYFPLISKNLSFLALIPKMPDFLSTNSKNSRFSDLTKNGVLVINKSRRFEHVIYAGIPKNRDFLALIPKIPYSFLIFILSHILLISFPYFHIEPYSSHKWGTSVVASSGLFLEPATARERGTTWMTVIWKWQTRFGFKTWLACFFLFRWTADTGVPRSWETTPPPRTTIWP